jgi:branched-subunit amino acid ABC-type transport system permease component
MIANMLDGLVLGLQFGLLAAGLTLVYGMGGVLNLAYGQMAVISAILMVLIMDAGVPTWPAVGLGLLAGGLLGLILDLTILRPVYRLHEEARVLLSLLLTLGVSFIADGFLNWQSLRDVVRGARHWNAFVMRGVRRRITFGRSEVNSSRWWRSAGAKRQARSPRR